MIKKFIWMTLFIAFASFVSAQTYNVSMEAQLYDSGGSILSGTYNVSVLLYNESDSGLFYNRTYEVETDDNGRFYVYLNVTFNNSDYYWVSFKIADDNETNLSQVGYVPYAINSKYLDGKNLSYFDGRFDHIESNYLNKSANETITGQVTFQDEVWFYDNVSFINSTIRVVTRQQMSVNNSLCIKSVEGNCQINMTGYNSEGVIDTHNLTISNIHNRSAEIRFYGNVNITEYNITEVEYVNNMKWNITYTGNEVTVETYYS